MTEINEESLDEEERNTEKVDDEEEYEITLAELKSETILKDKVTVIDAINSTLDIKASCSKTEPLKS